MKKQKYWEKWEIDYLKDNYSNSCMDGILEQLSDRTKSSITNKAYLLGLDNRSSKLANLNKLLDESNETYYWMGFLLADGHFSKSGQIQINLSEKDLEHLKKFSTFVEYKKELNKGSLYISDNNVFPLIVDKFNIVSDKTYNPSDISFITDYDLLFSLIIGFIDGDGSITKKGYIHIKTHKSWVHNIEYMFSKLDLSNYTVKINKEELAIGTISNIESTKRLRIKAEQLNLPILKRKWNNVDLTKLSKKEKTQQYEDECYRLFHKGLKPKEVICKTKYSSSFVYKTYNKCKRQAIKERDVKRDMARNESIN